MAKRILIADDSVTIQKAFAMTFGSEDVALTTARSAEEGLALAQKSRPDLIIADGAMPGRSGYDFCVQVRSDPSLRGVPVYILASGQQPYDEARGQKAGADGHLLKPWETNAFIEKVRDAISKGSTIGGPTAQPRVALSSTARATAASLPASAMDDDYGEISIETGRDSAPETPLPVVTAPLPGASPRATATSMPAVGVPGPSGLRPSLIPGMRPGTVSPARPGTVPVRPLGSTGGFQPSAPPRPAVPTVGRTMIGLPAANVPIPGAMRPAAPTAPHQTPFARAHPVAPPQAPFAPAHPVALPPASPLAAPPAPSRAREITPPPRAREITPPPRAREITPPPKVASAVDQTLAAIAAKGPEYEAIAKLSREIIEKIVWEVVPDLAEAIIREQIEKRGV